MSLEPTDLPPLATIQRRAKPTLAPSSRGKERVYSLHLADGQCRRVVANTATAAVLDRLISEGEVRGGDRSIVRAVAKARAAGVRLAVTRVPRADGGSGYVARYTMAHDTSLEAVRAP